MLKAQTRMIRPMPIAIGSERSKVPAFSVQVLSENHSAWISVPATSPLMESTTDQPIQYPKLASGPMIVRYLRQASWA